MATIREDSKFNGLLEKRAGRMTHGREFVVSVRRSNAKTSDLP